MDAPSGTALRLAEAVAEGRGPGDRRLVLARVGETDRFFRALCQADPIGIRQLVPTATLRQANCYYSSSDAAFQDRYQASAEYERIAQGKVPLDGGWRVYSSGAVDRKWLATGDV